jgi:hypothetical protein
MVFEIGGCHLFSFPPFQLPAEVLLEIIAYSGGSIGTANTIQCNQDLIIYLKLGRSYALWVYAHIRPICHGWRWRIWNNTNVGRILIKASGCFYISLLPKHEVNVILRG